MRYSPLCNDVVCAYADDIGIVGAHCTMPGGCFYESSAGEGLPPTESAEQGSAGIPGTPYRGYGPGEGH